MPSFFCIREPAYLFYFILQRFLLHDVFSLRLYFPYFQLRIHSCKLQGKIKGSVLQLWEGKALITPPLYIIYTLSTHFSHPPPSVPSPNSMWTYFLTFFRNNELQSFWEFKKIPTRKTDSKRNFSASYFLL
jgi:hypothetical protein